MANANIRAVITAEDNASAVVNTFSANIDKNNKKITQSNNNTNESFNRMLVATAGLAVASRRLVGVIDDTVVAANKEQAAMTGLTSIAKAFGQSQDEATKAAKRLTEDGLLNIADAARGLKNLLQSGFSLPEAIKLMERFKDSAAFGKQSALTFGDAVASATEGIKNGNSILVDNAGVTKNLSVILTEAGFSAQDLMRATTDSSVRMALFNGIIKETNPQVGDAAKLTELYAGKQATLAQKTFELKSQIGEALQPALAKLLETITPIVERFAKFATDHPQVTAAILLITTGAIALLAVLGSVGLAVMGLTPIFKAFAVASSGSIHLVTIATTGLKTLLSIPMVMPALVVVAALASLHQVYQAVQSIRQAINDVNNAAKAANNLAPEEQMRQLQRQATAARARGDTGEVRRLSNALSALGGNAAGTGFWGGGATLVGEQGPEIVNLPRGSQVVPNDRTEKMMGGNTINLNVNVGMYAGTPMERRKLAETLWRDFQDVASQRNAQMGAM